jgi:hypothetical protein
MNIWMLATMALYAIPLFYLVDDFEYLEESVEETLPDLDEDSIRAVSMLVILFWPVSAITIILLGDKE